MSAKIAINGFGRIGRGFMRAAFGREGLEIVAINDLAESARLAYLLKYDSVYGKAPFEVSAGEKTLIIDSKIVHLSAEKDPASVPWKSLGIDIVVESSGYFTEAEKAKAHITAGAKRVVITAPAKPARPDDSLPDSVIQAGGRSGGGDGVETILIGANKAKFDTLKNGACQISSNASC